MIRRPPHSTLFPTRRSSDLLSEADRAAHARTEFHDVIRTDVIEALSAGVFGWADDMLAFVRPWGDRKSTRLNSSHTVISYAVFCLKKKKHKQTYDRQQAYHH